MPLTGIPGENDRKKNYSNLLMYAGFLQIQSTTDHRTKFLNLFLKVPQFHLNFHIEVSCKSSFSLMKTDYKENVLIRARAPMV